MKFLILLALCIATVAAESCKRVSDCQETQCSNEHGWWLHCTQNYCLCSHDTYTGKPCADGQTATCDAAHGDRCGNAGLQWRCVDQVCHCSKY